MAFTARLTDSIGNTIDFLDTLGAWCLEYASYQPLDGAAFTENIEAGGFVVESLPLFARSTMPAPKIQTASEEIVTFLENARLWADDPVRTNAIWFEYYAEGDNPVRRLVHGGTLQRRDMPAMPASLELAANVTDGKARSWLTLFLSPWQESLVSDNAGMGTISERGGTLVVSTDGVRQGRLDKLTLSNEVGTGAVGVTTAWIGLRAHRDGFSSFKADWDAFLASSLGAGAVKVAIGGSPSGSTGGGVVQKTLSLGLAKVFDIALADITVADQEHWYGDYTVLARVFNAVSPSDIFGFRLRWGVTETNLTDNNEVFAQGGGSGYIWVDLGKINIPGYAVRDTTLFNSRFVMQLQAEQVGGTGYLMSFDQLVIVPSDRFVKVDTSIGFGIGSSIFEARRNQDEEMTGLVVITGEVRDNSSVRQENWYIPAEGATLVIASGTRNLFSLNDEVYLTSADSTIDVNAGTVDRWEAWQDG